MVQHPMRLFKDSSTASLEGVRRKRHRCDPCRKSLFLDGVSTPKYTPTRAARRSYGFSSGRVGGDLAALPDRFRMGQRRGKRAMMATRCFCGCFA